MVIDVKEWLSLDKCMNKVGYQTFQKMGVLEMCECIHTNIHQLVYLTFVQVTASFIYVVRWVIASPSPKMSTIQSLEHANILPYLAR